MTVDHLSQVARDARAAGMSYGKYQALLFEKNGYVSARRVEEPAPQIPEPEPKPSGRICVICGNPIYGKVSGRTKTCGKECSAQLNLKRVRERYHETKGAVNRIEKPCAYCGKIFTTRRDYQRYCSGNCRDKYKSAVHRGAENPTAQSVGMANRVYGKAKCGFCGSEFMRRSASHRFCTPECARLNKRKRW